MPFVAMASEPAPAIALEAAQRTLALEPADDEAFRSPVLALDALGNSVTVTVGIDNWSVTSNPPAEPGVSAIEVTQGVQDLVDSVALVGERSTTVRVYLASPAGAIISPMVELIGLAANGSPLPGNRICIAGSVNI